MRLLVTGGSGFIGTNVLSQLPQSVNSVLNLDINPPKIEKLNHSWMKCDIRDAALLDKLIKEFDPSHILHLAARTDVEGKSIEDYDSNIEGTQNLIAAINSHGGVKHVIITSSQFVYQAETPPKHDEDFRPHTVYGESKAITEKDTRNQMIGSNWTIIRPTNVWGPWHPRYPQEFWRVIGEGKYIHPNKNDVVRSYGYVQTVINQIFAIYSAPPHIVGKQVFYVGDPAINLIEWVNGFSVKQIGRKVIIVPAGVVYLLGVIGDILKSVGVSFPITRSRYRSMTTSNPAPIEKTISLFPGTSVTLERGINDTVKWLKKYHPGLVKH
jgi:GlcNAc-P-P-Und epimerase